MKDDKDLKEVLSEDYKSPFFNDDYSGLSPEDKAKQMEVDKLFDDWMSGKIYMRRMTPEQEEKIKEKVRKEAYPEAGEVD